MLHIENFAGIRNADIELARMNVFIGPQASGKSVCAKLFFFFKECLNDTDSLHEFTKTERRTVHTKTFLKYFPSASWNKGIFTLRYVCDEFWIEVQRKASTSNTIEIIYSSRCDEILEAVRKSLKNMLTNTFPRTAISILQQPNSPLQNQNYFIPAGRSFFATFYRNIFLLLAHDQNIDPFLMEFGEFYETARTALVSYTQDPAKIKLLHRISKLICGKFYKFRAGDYIQMEDGREVAVENCSSGQQEALPLVATLWMIVQHDVLMKYSTFFIEEPEAHLYPSAQREIVHLFAAALDLSSEDSSSQYLITTHSPYILSALNNLMYAGKIARNFPARRSRVTALLDEATLIDPANVRAYFVSDGRVESIIDTETELVRATLLDEVSNELSQEFGHLLDIEFEEAAA